MTKYKDSIITCGGGGSSEVLNFIVEYDTNYKFKNLTPTDVV